MKHDQLFGHLAVAGAYTIFGLNIVFCKDIANADAVSPMLLFTLRAIGAASLFWLLSLFLPKEPIARGDIGLIMLASFVGLFVPQLTFLKAMTLSATIDASVMHTLSPIFTMFFAFLFLKEPITWKKALGVAISFGGVLLLIFNSVHATGVVEHTAPLGFVMLARMMLTAHMLHSTRQSLNATVLRVPLTMPKRHMTDWQMILQMPMRTMLMPIKEH